MKIRKGFVTNSSSSFILGFTSEENIKKRIGSRGSQRIF